MRESRVSGALQGGRIRYGLANRDHIECRDQRTEAFERELTYGFHFDVFLDLRAETLSDQDLAGRRFVAEPRCEVGHPSDRRVVGAALEPDLCRAAWS